MLSAAYSALIRSYSGIPRNVWMLGAINFINRCGGMVVAFLTLYLTGPLGFTVQQSGYVMACFGLGAVGGAMMGGRLTDTLGYYRVQFWSLIFNGLMLIALIWVTEFYTMCAAIAFLSLGSEVFRPANSVAIAANSDDSNRTRSFSVMRLAFNLGWTIAPALGGILAKWLGWHAMFWVDGVTCILAAFSMLLLIPVKRNATRPKQEIKDPKESPYRDRVFLAFFALTFVNGFVFMQFIWTVPMFFRDSFAWSEDTIGYLVALNGLIVAIVEMPLIFRIEGRFSNFKLIRIGLLLYAFSYMCFLIPHGNWMAALMFVVAISLGEIMVMPFSATFVSQRSGPKRQGEYMALYVLSYSAANVVASMVATQIIAMAGYSALWLFLCALCGLSYLGMILLERKL